MIRLRSCASTHTTRREHSNRLMESQLVLEQDCPNIGWGSGNSLEGFEMNTDQVAPEVAGLHPALVHRSIL
jgi:hypothetical protein